MDKNNKQLGVSLKNTPHLLVEVLKSWQGWLGMLGIVVIAIILSPSVKGLVIISAIIFLLPAFRLATKRISEEQITQLGAPQQVTKQQLSKQGWQTTCFIKADKAEPFPDNWANGQVTSNADMLTWQSSSILHKADRLSINLGQQHLRVLQTRELEGNENFHIKVRTFTIIECQSSNGAQVLLAIPKDFADLIIQALKNT
jgi:hypothetical protein